MKNIKKVKKNINEIYKFIKNLEKKVFKIYNMKIMWQ